MRTFNLKDQIDPLLQERRLLTLVETVNAIDPFVELYSYNVPGKTEYENIVWQNLADKSRFPLSVIQAEQLQRTKDLWITLLMEEANLIQQKALSLHTITKDTPMHQKELYDEKYTSAAEYVSEVQDWQAANNTTDVPTHEQVPVPDIIYEEGSRTNEPFYYLCLAIIDNYKTSRATLQKFYGQVEGERRVAKKRIKDCTTIEELMNVQWAQWPDYVGNPPDPED